MVAATLSTEIEPMLRAHRHAGHARLMNKNPDLQVKLLAQGQGGVFTMAQANDRGLCRQSVHRRVTWGWYERVGHGVYRDVAVPVSDRTHRFAALLGVGRDAVLARETAGDVHGLSSTPRTDHVHLLVGCSCPHRRAGITVHRSLTLCATHRTKVAGYDVTTVERTLCDLAAVSGPVRLRRLVAEAVRRNLCRPEQIRRVMDEMGRFRGKVALRDLVDELSPLTVVTRSALESEFLALASAAGIPPTAMNHSVIDAHGDHRRIDAVYLPPGLPIELDSRWAHGSLLDWHDDLRRENAIVIEGWLPFLRYNWFDVTQRGHLVVAQIRDVLARAA